MARPRTRTAVLDPGELELFKGQFGSCTFAYEQLRVGVSYPSFQRAWVGKEVTAAEVKAIREGWDAYALRQIMVFREYLKAPVGEMFTPGGTPVQAPPFERVA
jgi:hypothetical protein